MKVERFLKEYASYKKEVIKNNELIKSDIKENALFKIDKVLSLKEKGFITVDEALKIMIDAFEQ